MKREELPNGLRDRPWDEKRKIPVPLFNVMDDGSVDYTGINARRVFQAASDGKCAACGLPLVYWIAFVGGPISYENHVYQDGPMHPLCAIASLTLCPHLRVKRHQGLTDEEHEARGDYSSGDPVLGKPEVVIIGITRTFKINVMQNYRFLFTSGTWKRRYVCEYDENGIIQVPDHGMEKE